MLRALYYRQGHGVYENERAIACREEGDCSTCKGTPPTAIQRPSASRPSRIEPVSGDDATTTLRVPESESRKCVDHESRAKVRGKRMETGSAGISEEAHVQASVPL